MEIRLMLVEDTESDIETCLSTVKVYNKQNAHQINCVVTKTRDDALRSLDSSFDGAIVDLKLTEGSDSTEGNDVIADIHSKWRIPLIILSGTPESAQAECCYLGCFKKGEIEYREIFDKFYEIYKTGLTKIMGGRGAIEDAMQKIFWNHLLPQLNTWKKYSSEGKETERSILRFVLNHLLELLNNDENPSHPEEMFIVPPIHKGIRTGSIIANNTNGKQYIVISPACDLVMRKNGTYKTDKVLVSEIVPIESITEQVLNGITTNEKRKKKIEELLKNNHADYFHWLPKTDNFSGGFINFRWINSVEKDPLQKEYGEPVAQLSAPFVKEVISRFSAFYARQGQPDLNFGELAATYAVDAPVQ